MSANARALCAATVVLWSTTGVASAASFVVDPAASHVRIHLGRSGLLKFLGHDHEIDAPIAEGRVTTGEHPLAASVYLRFEAQRLAVVPGTEPAGDVPKVDERMRGPEVLDVERHPEIAFASSGVEVESLGGERRRARVHGELTLKGRRVAVEIPVEVSTDGDGIVATGERELELRALGIEPPAVAGVVRVANRFSVSFEIRARPAAELPAR
jgi:polyisoprenoid-binding protein YceI